ncbi:MAG: helix-turn-helix domain-containing protein [Firmicutes bacterium]|nr:helix-turn-helix domain-containing protein [Bacillota bacterium]
MRKFCERLKELRSEKEISLNSLGKIINVSGVSISRWENGKADITSDYLVQLARYFGVSTDYLLGEEED